MYAAILNGKGATGKTLQEAWEELKNEGAEDWEFENVCFYLIDKPLQVQQTIIEVPVVTVSEVKSTTRK